MAVERMVCCSMQPVRALKSRPGRLRAGVGVNWNRRVCLLSGPRLSNSLSSRSSKSSSWPAIFCRLFQASSSRSSKSFIAGSSEVACFRVIEVPAVVAWQLIALLKTSSNQEPTKWRRIVLSVYLRISSHHSMLQLHLLGPPGSRSPLLDERWSGDSSRRRLLLARLRRLLHPIQPNRDLLQQRILDFKRFLKKPKSR